MAVFPSTPVASSLFPFNLESSSKYHFGNKLSLMHQANLSRINQTKVRMCVFVVNRRFSSICELDVVISGLEKEEKIRECLFLHSL